MQRILITGANGSGKSRLARLIKAERPDLPLHAYDAIRLTRNWVKRPTPDIDAALAEILQSDRWILEGGPSLLKPAMGRADVIIWLDPPELTRAWRLLQRPLRHIGQTRPELPKGNQDWPLAQYRFAFQSLRKGQWFRRTVRATLSAANHPAVWHCRSNSDVGLAIENVRASAPSPE
ncbi:MAG: DNA topology modulation protein FlaR [Pseudomonadota bacterium]